jgi:hypothetical protein
VNYKVFEEGSYEEISQFMRNFGVEPEMEGAYELGKGILNMIRNGEGRNGKGRQ